MRQFSFLMTCYGLLYAIFVSASALEGEYFAQKEMRFYSVTIDLRQDTLKLYWKNQQNNNLSSIAMLKDYLALQKESLLFAVNAGIYTQDNKPLGLHIEAHQILMPLNTSNPINPKGNFSLKPNGVFYIQNQTAAILETNAFARKFNSIAEIKTIDVATQSGPMLLINRIFHPMFLKDSDSFKYRSSVCVRSQNPHQVIFSVSLNPINFYDFALFLRDQMQCDNALYLDGSLSQIYYQDQYYGAPFWKLRPYVGMFAVSKVLTP